MPHKRVWVPYVQYRDIFAPEGVKHFFETSSYEARLVFLRDAQSQGLLFDYEEMKHDLQEQLRQMQ